MNIYMYREKILWKIRNKSVYIIYKEKRRRRRTLYSRLVDSHNNNGAPQSFSPPKTKSSSPFSVYSAIWTCDVFSMLSILRPSCLIISFLFFRFFTVDRARPETLVAVFCCLVLLLCPCCCLLLML